MKSERQKKAEEKTSAAPKKRVVTKKPKVEVPSILLEGDAPAAGAQQPSGPGERFAGVRRPIVSTPAPKQELPEAYGTGRMLLTARDPHWLYAHWDLTREQLRASNAVSVDGHLILRIYQNAIEGTPATEVHVHPESTNWFVNVPHPNARYVAQLGYNTPGGRWIAVATSASTITPPESMSEDHSAWFATLPAELQITELVKVVKSAISESIPLMEAIQQLRAMGYLQLPDPQAISPGKWTAEQERALLDVINMDAVRRIWIGSVEVTELVRRKWQQELFSAAAAEFSAPSSWSGGLVPSSLELSSLSSPFGVGEGRKGFWFKVNAELIIYGATEPDATVTIGERQIRLRPDGTFSYRFSLPDGKYDLPAVAIASDQTDSRAAALTFSRKTEYRGDVAPHPQDPRLKPPQPGNLDR
jgi:uncharacterized protein